MRVWDDMISSTCIQGGGAGNLRLGGGYEPNHIMHARSPAPGNAWMGSIAQAQMKQEPMDHDSSAYGSDFHSSPSGSDSRDSNPVPFNSTLNNNIPISQYYNTPVTNRMPFQPLNNGFNPLTPPSFEPISPKTKNENFQENTNATLTPCTTPPNEVTPPKSPKKVSESEESYCEGKSDEGDHLRRLQMAFERNGMLPKDKEQRDSADEDAKSDYDTDEVDEQGLRIPRVNSHGKIKTFKCKQCGFVAVTKLDFWEHSRGHIKADKILTCPKCPFVTEYKHHLEYHLRNHVGSKPFKCDKCSYSCVNKSMLNSHLKSHSNVYQYRCADCTYATKYCHSLKLHLRKYKHSPAMVLNPDGTPNPLPIIDVYGTRRGPKQKASGKPGEPESNSNEAPPMNLPPHSIFPPFMLPGSQPNGMPLPFPYGPLLGAFSNPLLFPQMNPGQTSPTYSNHSNDRSTPESLKIDENSTEKLEASPEKQREEVLDLSKPEITLPINVPEVPANTPIALNNPVKNRRKGRAFKLERIAKDASSDEEILEDTPEKIEDVEEIKVCEPNKKSDIFNCQHCDIAFRDILMYTMHMGYHGYKDPFTCNMCGEQSADKVSFFLHIARNSHS